MLAKAGGGDVATDSAKPPVGEKQSISISISIPIEVDEGELDQTNEAGPPSDMRGAEDLNRPPYDADTSAKTRKGSSEEILSRAMYERFLESDYPRALTIAETVLELNPTHPMAAAVVERCRAVQESHRTDASAITPSMVLALTIPPAHLRMLPLDPKFVFLLSRLDGKVDLETVLDLSGQRLEDVRERLADLLWRGIVGTATT
jgi:hypothetical protein